MYSLIIKQFIRTKTTLLALSLIFLMGVISILIGKQFITKQEQSITEVTSYQQEHIQRNVNYSNGEMGLLLYYLKFALINKPDRLTALSIGQRDINPAVQSVTIRTLEAQKYDTDLTNPSVLQMGNLDLGFVIIYLFPLVIIAFTFNLLSEEKESGTWRMVAVQSKSILGFLLYKLSVRAIFVYAALAALFIIAIGSLSLPVNGALILFIVPSALYLAFWFALCFWILSLRRNSDFNALTLLSLWVVLAILLPASVNNYVANKYLVPESLSTMVKQRDGYHEKWDMDKGVTMDKFYSHYPEFKKYGLPEETFSWLWYYAMQQMGDDDAAEQSNAMREKILQREKTSRTIALAIPTMNVQLLLNDIARSSLSDHLYFLDRTNAFHERLRLYFYPKIFEDTSVKNEDWAAFIPEYIAGSPGVKWSVALISLLIITGVFSVFSVINLKRLRTI